MIDNGAPRRDKHAGPDARLLPARRDGGFRQVRAPERRVGRLRPGDHLPRCVEAFYTRLRPDYHRVSRRPSEGRMLKRWRTLATISMSADARTPRALCLPRHGSWALAQFVTPRLSSLSQAGFLLLRHLAQQRRLPRPYWNPRCPPVSYRRGGRGGPSRDWQLRGSRCRLPRRQHVQVRHGLLHLQD